MVAHYLLDTNQLSRFLTNHPAVVERIAAVGMDRLATSPIVYGELSFMAYHSKDVENNLKKIHRFFELITVLPIDFETISIYGELKSDFLRHYGPKETTKRARIKLENLGLSDHDLWIAAAAIRNHCTLVSADSDFVRIGCVHPLDLEAWWHPSMDV